MNESMIVWCAIVALLVVVLLVRSAVRYSRISHRDEKSVSTGMHHLPLLSVGKERDMLFMPGDALHADDDSDEY